MYGGLSGGSDVCQTVSSPLVFAVLFGGSGGVANLKTVPIYQGVTDVFLRSSYPIDSDEPLASFVVAASDSIAATLLLISI